MQQVQPGPKEDQEGPTTDFYSSHNKYAAGEQSEKYGDPSLMWHRGWDGGLIPDRDEDDYSGRGKDGELGTHCGAGESFGTGYCWYSFSLCVE